MSANQSRPTTRKGLKLGLSVAAVTIAACTPSALASSGGRASSWIPETRARPSLAGHHSVRAKGHDWQQDKWFYGQRAYPHRTIAPGSLARAERRAEANRQRSLRPDEPAARAAPTAPLNWSSFGPGRSQGAYLATTTAALRGRAGSRRSLTIQTTPPSPTSVRPTEASGKRQTPGSIGSRFSISSGERARLRLRLAPSRSIPKVPQSSM